MREYWYFICICRQPSAVDGPRHRMPLYRQLSGNTGKRQRQIRPEIFEIIDHVKFISNHLRKARAMVGVKLQWKFAAVVLDRISLILCVAIFVGLNGSFVLTAPNLIIERNV